MSHPVYPKLPHAWEQENEEKEERDDNEEAAVKRHLYFAVYRRTSANCFPLSESNDECCCGRKYRDGLKGGAEVA